MFSSAGDVATTLEHRFRQIERTRMTGVPVVNDKLAVRAIGFRPWREHWLGILLTPWFMNLMLLPQEEAPTKALSPPGRGFGRGGKQSFFTLSPAFSLKGEGAQSSLLRQPREGGSDEVPVGAARTFVFPSGSYDFVAGHEEGVGHYYSCSLFSPVFEFESQEAAERTAEAALAAIMDEENFDAASQRREREVEAIWKGETPPAEEGSEQAKKPLQQRLAEPMSRRAFLRGGVFSERRDREP